MPTQLTASDNPLMATPCPPGLLDLMAELVGIVDAAGQLIYVNRAWERAMGYTQAEALHIRPRDLVAYEDRGRYRSAIQRVVLGEKVVDFEAVLLTKSGAERSV